MAVDRTERDRNDVILMPRQYAIIKDMTKGNLSVHVGPFKVTLSDAERLMAPDTKNPSRLREVGQEEAILPYIDAGESDYVVLNNPVKDVSSVLKPKAQHEMVDLQFGRKVNIPGPVSFPLWPFQFVDVIPGHQLQMNQYLVVRVVNDEEALANWNKGVVKTVEGEETKGIARPTSLSIGQLIIIKGTEVSFYIPPTGLEVVKDANGNYVRDAVTLEQLEYCVLINQNGEKRFEQGPKVVFPNPTEEFVNEYNSTKFKATELTEISGLHIKVTAPYTEGGKSYKAGDELFLTGKETPIYFPRAEHAIVRYGKRTKHYAIAIPKGEGRYVLNRLTGVISLIRGPKMLLPDPRSEVVVRRILPEKQVELWYSGNVEAININRELAGKAFGDGTSDYVTSDSTNFAESLLSSIGERDTVGGYTSTHSLRKASTKLVGDEMKRSETYTPPRTITINTKYEGAVQVCPWTGYAVLIVDKSGNRKVVVGPDTVLLEFDQELASMEFSTGKPKTTDKLYKTAYLRVLNNQVSDIIDAMTSDDIPVRIKTSYRVNFLPEYKDKWFDAENYVKLLCDHVRSKLRNAVKHLGIQELTNKHIDLVRDTVLGVKPDEKTPRPGLTFEENGAHVYDVEVLGLEIGDSNIAKQLLEAQRCTIQDSLTLTTQKRHLELSREQETINQQLEALRAATEIQKIQLAKTIAEQNAQATMTMLEARTAEIQAQQQVEIEKQKVNDISAQSTLAREKAQSDQKMVELKAKLEVELKKIEEETKNLAERTKAVTPDLIAALQRFADMSLAEKMADSMAPMALLGGKSVAEVLGGLLKGTGLEKLVTGVALGTGLERLNKGNGTMVTDLSQVTR
jgi:major vault protein